MTCDFVRKQIPLYFYGELTPEEEERVEEHLHLCADCARELQGQRALAAALDRSQVGIPRFLLEDCRAGLRAAIQSGVGQSRATFEDPMRAKPRRFSLDSLSEVLAQLLRHRQPIGALTLVALAFFAGRLTSWNLAGPNRMDVAPSDQVFATVRSVQPDGAGRVQVAFDETRRRIVSGDAGDARIQSLLLAASREENPAVRVESVDLLKARAGSGEVRDALLNAVAHDPNPGVRLKALEGLKPLAAEEDVRKTLAQVLMTDDNAAVRIQVVDLLVARPDDSMVGVLQNLVQKDDNSYVRLKCEKALKEMNASIGTF
jgi:HEAT repeats/Putative zinc-finger